MNSPTLQPTSCILLPWSHKRCQHRQRRSDLTREQPAFGSAGIRSPSVRSCGSLGRALPGTVIRLRRSRPFVMGTGCRCNHGSVSLLPRIVSAPHRSLPARCSTVPGFRPRPVPGTSLFSPGPCRRQKARRPCAAADLPGRCLSFSRAPRGPAGSFWSPPGSARSTR